MIDQSLKMNKLNKQLHTETITAGFAILAFIFLFIMTATEGKYWGSNEMDEYIIKITEGEDQSYLDSKTPTAMVINKLSAEEDICTIAEQGYIISHGRKIAQITY